MSAGSGKSVVVIGGTGGIGHAIAKFYADHGCDVVITGRDEERTDGCRERNRRQRRAASRSTSRSRRRSRRALASLGHIDSSRARRRRPRLQQRPRLRRRARAQDRDVEAHRLHRSRAHAVPAHGRRRVGRAVRWSRERAPVSGLDVDHHGQRRGQQLDSHAGRRARAGAFQRHPSGHHLGHARVVGQERSRREHREAHAGWPARDDRRRGSTRSTSCSRIAASTASTS